MQEHSKTILYLILAFGGYCVYIFFRSIGRMTSPSKKIEPPAQAPADPAGTGSIEISETVVQGDKTTTRTIRRF